MNTLEQQITHLESRINELISFTARLKDENRSLRASQESLNQERASLIERNDNARSQVEAMIRRLKNMETMG